MDMAIELLGTFGKRLRVLREEHGMDQTEFAAAVSRRLDRQTLSNSSVSSMESGRSRPSLDVLLAILRELDVSADYLLFGDGSPNRAEEAPEPPAYYTEEADEAARLIDAMPEGRRAEALALVRVIAQAAGVADTAPPSVESVEFSRSITRKSREGAPEPT